MITDGSVSKTVFSILHIPTTHACQAALNNCTADLNGNTVTLSLSMPVYNAAHTQSTAQTLTATKTVNVPTGTYAEGYSAGYTAGLSAGTSSTGAHDVLVGFGGRLNRSDYGSSSMSGYSNPSGKPWETSAVVDVLDSSNNTILTKTKNVQIAATNLNWNHIVNSVNIKRVDIYMDANRNVTSVSVRIEGLSGAYRVGTPDDKYVWEP